MYSKYSGRPILLGHVHIEGSDRAGQSFVTMSNRMVKPFMRRAQSTNKVRHLWSDCLCASPTRQNLTRRLKAHDDADLRRHSIEFPVANRGRRKSFEEFRAR